MQKQSTSFGMFFFLLVLLFGLFTGSHGFTLGGNNSNNKVGVLETTTKYPSQTFNGVINQPANAKTQPGGRLIPSSHLGSSISSLRSTSCRGGALESNEESFISKIIKKADRNFFLVGLFIAVTLAKTFPFLGVDKGILRPELFIGNYGVALIFLLSGLSLQTSELAKAASNLKLNGLVQLLIFGVWPFLIGVPIKSLLTKTLPNVIPSALVDGFLILSCLPTTINMCIMLTSAGGGNVATSICNAVISNVAGIFLTPALLFHFFGADIELPFLAMVLKLCKKVLLPVAIGQALRATSMKEVYNKNSKLFKRLQETILLGIVWNAFCNAFSNGLGLELKHSLFLLTLLPTVHLTSLGAMLKFFNIPSLKFTREEAVAAAFCASQKTLAFGLPLINTVFEGNPNLAAYCAPLMFVHPLQMTLGSILLPFIRKFASDGDEEKLLGLK